MAALFWRWSRAEGYGRRRRSGSGSAAGDPGRRKELLVFRQVAPEMVAPVALVADQVELAVLHGAGGDELAVDIVARRVAQLEAEPVGVAELRRSEVPPGGDCRLRLLRERRLEEFHHLVRRHVGAEGRQLPG